MTDSANLLTTRQMAEFTANGMLRFDELVEPALCERIHALFEAGEGKTRGGAGDPLDHIWDADHPLGQLVRHPRVAGIIESLIGPNCRYDHHAVHTTKPGTGRAQFLHQDAEYDPRFGTFDIQLSFFPADTTPEMGGTRFLPGSHFRRVNESVIGRYQHIVGMVQTVCRAGTLVAWHTNLWHGAQPNLSDRTRYMFKLRLNPMVRQQRLWNTADQNDPEVMRILSRPQPWYGQSHRVEFINRARFWRGLTGDPEFDLGFWLSRIEHEPTVTYRPPRAG